MSIFIADFSIVYLIIGKKKKNWKKKKKIMRVGDRVPNRFVGPETQKKIKLKQQTTRKQARKERREMELTGEKYGCGKSVRQGKHKRATCL
jgi:hypothetical protein